MSNKRWTSIAMVFTLVSATQVLGQATRTWVSGVGDDANPCSRTAPCKTFAGAISKTAPGGEINVLDPGGFGAVTITKPITISSEGFEAGVLVSGTNGVIVNVPNATDNVILRGLDFEGLGTGLNGITVLTGGSVHVENCTINHFTTNGINFVPTVAGSKLFVNDTIIRNNTGGNSAGIHVAPTGAGTAAVSLDTVRLENNNFGLRLQSNGTVATGHNVIANGNTGTGFQVLATTKTELNLDGCAASNNSNGIRSDNAGGVVRFARCTITNNTSNGLLMGSGGSTISFSSNTIQGNAGNQAPTSTLPPN